MVKQTAGRDSLGEFAPKFAELNDDVLFGEVWSREDKLSLRDRSLVTICVFMGKGMADSSLKHHLMNAKKNGITKEEMAEIITHAAFYAGWPNAWATFNLAKEVYADDNEEKTEHGGFFGQGEENTAYAKYFIGKSYLKPLTKPGSSVVSIANYKTETYSYFVDNLNSDITGSSFGFIAAFGMRYNFKKVYTGLNCDYTLANPAEIDLSAIRLNLEIGYRF